jgi:predicted nucleic acid-binding protein
MKIIIDAYAWVEYLEGSDKGKLVRQKLEAPDVDAYTCVLTVAEVVSKAMRSGKDPDVAYSSIVINSKIIEIDAESSKQAGIKHAEMKRIVRDFGLVDAYLLVYSERLGAKILTGDPHFQNVPVAIPLK